jgi:hypothetical protein
MKRNVGSQLLVRGSFSSSDKVAGSDPEKNRRRSQYYGESGEKIVVVRMEETPETLTTMRKHGLESADVSLNIAIGDRTLLIL